MSSTLSSSSPAVDVWRSRILSRVTWAYLGFSTLACIVGIWVAIQHALWSVVVFDACAWLTGIGLVLCPTRFYRFKSTGLIAMTYCVGLYFTYRFGPFAAGPFWLFAAPMLSGALLGWRTALATLGLVVVSLAGFGALLVRGWLDWPSAIDAERWFVISGNLVALSGLLSVSIGVLLDGVAQANREREDAVEARELLEQQLRHSQKMEAVGRLAGGIAHDFNNLLVAISGFTEFAIESLKDNASALADLSEVTKTVARGKGLTEQLLTFSRKNASAPQNIDINNRIEDANRLIEQLSGEGIQVHTKLSTERCTATIDPDSFIQILVNTTLNSRDAMQGGGDLRIETARIEVDPASPNSRGLEMEPGDYVMMSVSDTGCGIAGTALELIFEPFFTTKKTGEGTGLGLSTCWAIAKQADGYVNMLSELGRGSTFELYLPLSLSAAMEPAQSRVTSADSGDETILVVEDDEQVRRMLSRTLRAKGYRVFEASHAEEALALAEDAQSTFDLLVTDVIMPGHNGRELALMVAELNPEIAVLYVSGYSGEALTQRGILDADVMLLKKPFQLDVLVQEVRAILDARS